MKNFVGVFVVLLLASTFLLGFYARSVAPPALLVTGRSALLVQSLPSFIGSVNLRPLPSPVTVVNITQPLIFFHLRKCGGSSIRLFLKPFCQTVTCYIPMFNNLPGDIYSIQRADIPATSLYAGHFRWGVTSELGIGRPFLYPVKFSCFFNVRPPVERVLSCFNYRFVERRKMPELACIGELSPARFRYLLQEGRDQWGQGCLNEPIRIFTGEEDENVLGHVVSPASLQGEVMLRTSIDNFSQCIPMSLWDRHKSVTILNHFLPVISRDWNKLFDMEKYATIREASVLNRTSCDLLPAHWEVLSQLTALEQAWYDSVRARMGRFYDQALLALQTNVSEVLPEPRTETSDSTETIAMAPV